MRSNLAGPLVAAILARSRRSCRWAAEQAGVSHVALGERLRGAGPGVSLATLQAAALAAEATAEELALIADLDAIDRGALPLDELTTPAELKAARAAILAEREAR